MTVELLQREQTRRLQREQARARAREFAIEAARAIHDDKCTDVLVLDLKGLSSLSDYIVIGSGTSDRQMRSAGEEVNRRGKSQGFEAVRRSGDDKSTWVLVDFVDVIVHIFEPETRAHYDLEMLWGDAPRVEWRRTPEETRAKHGAPTTPDAPATMEPTADAVAPKKAAPKKAVAPRKAAPRRKVAKPKKAAKPKKVTKQKKMAKPKKVGKGKKATKSKHAAKPKKGAKRRSPAKAGGGAKLKKRAKPQRTTR